MRWARALVAGALLSWVAAGCAAGPADPAPALADPPAPERVLLAGDSLTVGYHATRAADSYAALLLAEWGAEGVRVEEAGARAWRIARGVEQLAERGDLDADVAVLEVGANDVGKTPVPEYADALRDLVVAAEEGGAEVVVCLGPWNDTARTAAYDRRVARTCDSATHPGRVHVLLSDLYDDPALRGPAGTPTHLGERDDFHPNDAGHAAIARRVADAVQDLVPGSGAWLSTPPDPP